jgi:hypothetical protein
MSSERGIQRGRAGRILEALADAWRERSVERRAAGAPKAWPQARLARSRLGAALEARLAVRAGVRIDDFLRSRLANYAARLPVTLEDLPVSVEIVGGEAVFREKSSPHAAPARQAPDSEPALSRTLVLSEGPYAAREIRDAEVELDTLDVRAIDTQARIDELSRAYADAIASGEVAVRPDIEATVEQLGRPPVPSPAPIAGLRAFVAALLVAEAWRFSGPVLDLAGIESAELEAALQVSPVPAVFALAFAIGAAAAVFAFAAVALSRATDAIDDAAAPRRRLLLGLGGLVAALAAGGVAAAATAPERWGQTILLVTVPFAGALLWRWSSHLSRIRHAALDAALAWDRDRTREAADRGRHVGLIAAAQAELASIDAERVAARRRLRRLHRRAVDAERQASAAARADARRMDRLCEGLAAALELDRYLYIRLSSERTHAVAVERPVRAGRLEPAVASERLGIAG